MNSNEMIDLDLPSFQSLILGNGTLHGNENVLCSLTMRSTKEMIRIDGM